MRLRTIDCEVTISDELIRADFRPNFKMQFWVLELYDDELCIRWNGVKQNCFKVSEIEEIQFVMGEGPGRYNPKATAYVYVKLLNDPDLRSFFFLTIAEVYIFANKTKAYQYCEIILNKIAEKYGIVTTYKLSINHKNHFWQIALPFILIPIAMLIIWIRFKYFR
jgi:hypothetical protein